MKPYNYPNRFESAFDDHVEDPTDRRVCAGMADTLWADAWASYEEEVEGRHYGGQEMLEIAGTPDGDQIQEIVDWVLWARTKTCEANRVARLADLYDQACAADRLADKELDSPEAFGSDLGMQIQGSGVSWFDDHAAFPMELPYMEWGWTYLDWPECNLKLTWGELQSLKDILAAAEYPIPDVPAHRLAALVRKVDEAYGLPTDDASAEDT